MKKIISILILLSLFTLNSCLFLDNDKDSTVRIGYLAGPTGMGMAKMIIDNNGLDGGNEKYTFTKYADTTTAMQDLEVGRVDIICLPTSDAANYQTSVDNEAKVLALNCLNSLFLISENGQKLEDFEGKTIYTCKNGTPRIVLEYLINALSLNVEISYTVDGKEMKSPDDVVAEMMAQKIPNAVLPEPKASTLLMKINTSATLRPSVALTNLGDYWDKVSQTPIAMGCVLASGNFVKNNKESIDCFLADYKASIEFIANEANFDSAAEYIQQTGIIPSLPMARAALLNLTNSIIYMDGEEMKNTLISFYLCIGITQPSIDFFYEK